MANSWASHTHTLWTRVNWQCASCLLSLHETGDGAFHWPENMLTTAFSEEQAASSSEYRYFNSCIHIRNLQQLGPVLSELLEHQSLQSTTTTTNNTQETERRDIKTPSVLRNSVRIYATRIEFGKNHKKVILLSIALTLRRCDDG